jgi:hypothetical protein
MITRIHTLMHQPEADPCPQCEPYILARQIWAKAMATADDLADSLLPDYLAHLQFQFEGIALTPDEGQILMGQTLVAWFFDPDHGWTDIPKAQRYLNAMHHPHISHHVRIAAHGLADRAGLGEDIT